MEGLKYTLRHTDDKKERYQSHQYELELTLSMLDSFSSIDICSYGETRHEAFENFKDAVDKLNQSLQSLTNIHTAVVEMNLQDD